MLQRRELGLMVVGIRDLALIAVTSVNRRWGSAKGNETQRMLNHCMTLSYLFKSL